MYYTYAKFVVSKTFPISRNVTIPAGGPSSHGVRGAGRGHVAGEGGGAVVCATTPGADGPPGLPLWSEGRWGREESGWGDTVPEIRRFGTGGKPVKVD